jgi:hypothetical protein
MCVLQVAHQIPGDADDSFPLRYGPDLTQGVGVEIEALDNELVVVGLPQGGELPPCESLPRNVSRIGSPSVYGVARFCSDLDLMLT